MREPAVADTDDSPIARSPRRTRGSRRTTTRSCARRSPSRRSPRPRARSTSAPAGSPDASATAACRTFTPTPPATSSADATAPPTLPPVVICAHLDTVFPRDTDLSVRREGERLVGPGINDNGRGLAVMLALAGEIDGVRLRSRRPDRVRRDDGRGGYRRSARREVLLRRLAARGAHATIALDGAGDERIIHRALGSRRFRVAYSGPGGHSWAAFGAPNAVHAAAALRRRIWPRCRCPRRRARRSPSAASAAGLSVNSIPDSAWLEIDLRSTSAAQLDDLRARDSSHRARRRRRRERASASRGTRALTVSVEIDRLATVRRDAGRACARAIGDRGDATRRASARSRPRVDRRERADQPGHSGDRDRRRRPRRRRAHPRRVVRQPARHRRRRARADDRHGRSRVRGGRASVIRVHAVRRSG